MYAAPIILLVWAVLVEVLGESAQLTMIRLVTVAAAVTVSIREVAKQRRKRDG